MHKCTLYILTINIQFIKDIGLSLLYIEYSSNSDFNI